MSSSMTNDQKKMILQRTAAGTVLNVHYKKENRMIKVIFEKMKRTRFDATWNGNSFSWPLSWFESVEDEPLTQMIADVKNKGRKTNAEKEYELRGMKKGTFIRVESGNGGKEVVIFQRMKQTNFSAKKKDGSNWTYPIGCYREVFETDKPYEMLMVGELFYIVKQHKPVLYKFKRLNGDKIVGVNPLSGVESTIDVQLYGGRIVELQDED